MQKARRAARELALNILYQVETAGLPFEEALETAKGQSSLKEDSLNYAESLSRGVFEKREELESEIRPLAPDWPPERQPSVDRNVLCIAIYEIKYMDDVPAVVSINEAVELAKRFSTEDSGKFVNGVLAGYLRSKGYEIESQKAVCSSGEGLI